MLKVTKNKKEIFMPSVVKITDLENEVQKLARKRIKEAAGLTAHFSVELATLL